MPHDEAMARNPPGGAAIDFFLREPPKASLTLSLFDARGELVRRYSSDAKPKPADPTEARVAPEWVQAPPALPAAAGMHRFVWSIRYAAPLALAGGDSEEGAASDGVWAPPGRYDVELNVDGERLRQPLTIAPDPRISLTAEAYQRQFTLARRVEAAAARVAAAAAEGEKLRRTLADRGQRDLEASLRSLLGPRFGELPTETGAVRVTPLRSLAATLRQFAVAVDNADGAPTPDAESGFAGLEPVVAATLAEWEALKAKAAAR
jgi:hypothetical protein